MLSIAWKFPTALAVIPDAHWLCAFRNHVTRMLKSSRSFRPTCTLRSVSALNQGANLWPASTQAGFCGSTGLAPDVNSEAAAVAENTAAASARPATNALRLHLLKSLRLSRRACCETASSRNEWYEPDWAGCRNVMAFMKLSSARAGGHVTPRADRRVPGEVSESAPENGALGFPLQAVGEFAPGLPRLRAGVTRSAHPGSGPAARASVLRAHARQGFGMAELIPAQTAGRTGRWMPWCAPEYLGAPDLRRFLLIICACEQCVVHVAAQQGRYSRLRYAQNTWNKLARSKNNQGCFWDRTPQEARSLLANVI